MPPVASSVARAVIVRSRPPGSTVSAPTQRPASITSSTAVQRSRRSISSCSTQRSSARWMCSPVRSPPACSTRGCECAPSRARASSPSAARSNSTPNAISRHTAAGPCSTSVRTARASHSPAPARIVSSACRCGSSPAAIAAAMPPCARLVLVSLVSPLLSRQTEPCSRASSAALRPASPVPMIRKSNWSDIAAAGGGRAQTISSMRSSATRAQRRVSSSTVIRFTTCPSANSSVTQAR